MKFTKPPLPPEQQADLLLQRGMTGDRDLMVTRLQSVGYYRLSAYWLPFRNSDDSFKPGTSFDTVWNRYAFDRRLRLLMMDAIERIEVSVRSQIAQHHGLIHSPFGYAEDNKTLPGLSPHDYREYLNRIKKETDRSRETFAKHFKRKYGDQHHNLPIWMVTEVMAFGTVLKFFENSSPKVKQQIANLFDMPAVVFNSWLLTLNTVRNVCAHHGRLWNRELGTAPKTPRAKKYPTWHFPVEVHCKRVFAVLTICHWCLARIAPQSHWPDRLRKLLDASPDIPFTPMGFPENWQECPIWRKP